MKIVTSHDVNDAVGLRNQMLKVQAKLHSFKILPKDMHAVAASIYTDVLQMQYEAP